MNEKISVLYLIPDILGALVYALTHARVIRFDKKYYLLGRLDKGQFEIRSAQNIQDKSDLTQYLGADLKTYQDKNNQLQHILPCYQNKLRSSLALLI